MKVAEEMKKIDMVNIMLDNDYPEAWGRLPAWRKRKNTKEEQREYLVNDLQYHVLKDTIYEMFRDYLYWKIENNQKIFFKKMLANA